MQNILDWFSRYRWRSSLSHILLTIPLFALVFIVSKFIGFQQPSIIATAFIVAWWWSREKTQHEYKLKGSERTITVWHKGWLPFEWDLYSVLDFGMPVLFSIVLVYFLI